jgi:phosphoribosyl 1,2-cyclic phosphodiesterase
MALYFQTICSSSSGNALALWSESTRILIDCGLGSMKRTRAALTTVFDDPTRVDAVLLTHTHGDHIAYYPLRVLEAYGLSVRLHEDCYDQLRHKHYNGYGFGDLDIVPFKAKPFTVGDLTITPFEVMHNPAYPTYGYQIGYRDSKIVIATDFQEWTGVFDAFVDADFIFVESNHDLDLLRQDYNPNSRYHLPNPDAAELLVNVRQEQQPLPSAQPRCGRVARQCSPRKPHTAPTGHAGPPEQPAERTGDRVGRNNGGLRHRRGGDGL